MAAPNALLGPDGDLAHFTVDGHATSWFPRSGCAAQAHIAVYGSLDAWARISHLPQEINLTLDEKARTDRRYLEAAHHYTYPPPTDIINKFAAHYRSDRE